MLNITLSIQGHVSIILSFSFVLTIFEKFVNYLQGGVTLAPVVNRYFKLQLSLVHTQPSIKKFNNKYYGFIIRDIPMIHNTIIRIEHDDLGIVKIK